jgi:hypothetical protein
MNSTEKSYPPPSDGDFYKRMSDLLGMLIREEIAQDKLYEFVGMLEHLKTVAIRHVQKQHGGKGVCDESST